jgi:hypothetical protein
MPTPPIISHHTRHNDCGTARYNVHYEAKSMEEFLELRDRLRADESCVGIVIVVVGIIVVALFIKWMYEE